jgi:carboxyl-terminal processing protease
MKPVIRIVAVLVIFILAEQAQGQNQKDLKNIIDSVVVKAKSIALNSRLVKWDSVKVLMYQRAQNAKSVQDLRESFETLLFSLNDKHGVFYDAATTSRIAGYPAYEDSEISTRKEFKGGQETKFDYRILHKNIRYIRLVGIPSGTDVQQQAEVIRHAVDSLSKEDAPYWIIDLRYAEGGDMNPFFAGMGPLLGEGLIATTIDNKRKIKDLYSVYNGKFYCNQVQVAKLPSSISDMRNVKIAVLTSRYTSGAAEILALGFNGRKNTKLFGETTAGQIVGSHPVKISGTLVMSISETIYNDRKGKAYKDSLTPETSIEFIPNVDVRHDKGITEATAWLTSDSASEPSTKVAMN